MRLRTLRQPRWMLIGAGKQGPVPSREEKPVTKVAGKASEAEIQRPAVKLTLVK